MLDRAIGLGEQNGGVMHADVVYLGNEGHTEALVHYVVDLPLADAHFFGEVAYPCALGQSVFVNERIDGLSLEIMILKILCGINFADIRA